MQWLSNCAWNPLRPLKLIMFLLVKIPPEDELSYHPCYILRNTKCVTSVWFFSLKINIHLLWTLSKELGIIKVMCTNKIVKITSLTKHFWLYFTKGQYYWDSTVLLKIEQYNFKKQQFVLVTSRNSVEFSLSEHVFMFMST